MSYHYSNLGHQFKPAYADMDGYIPEELSEWNSLNYDHGGESLYDDDDQLTEYGEWWRDEGFPLKLAEAEAGGEERQLEIERILGN
jgi:hypothetical protein